MKASKCAFGRDELGFLGRRASAGVAVDLAAAVRDRPIRPSNAELPRFVGLGNYYRRFVDGCAFIAAPLTRLCGPHAPWRSDPVEQEGFDTLKRCLTTAPVLRTLDSSRCSVTTTDANGVAISAVLAQPDDGHHRARGIGDPDVLFVDHNPKLLSAPFKELPVTTPFAGRRA